MSGKRKRIVLSMSDKVKIIEQLKKGVSGKQLAESFCVGTSTISDIKKNSESILNFVSALEREDGSSSRKVMRSAENKELEDVMFKWFLQQRAIGNPLSGPLICEKAKMFADKIDGIVDFKASNGWLRNFKARHGIRELDLCGEKLSANEESAADFVKDLKLKTEGYDPDFIYNADETGLNWKALPRKTLASKREVNTPGYKINKQRVTVLTCANSTGNHRLPLLLIGTSKAPRAFKHVTNLPVIYKNQKKSWMTAALFTEWLEEVFIPEVKKFQVEVGKTGNVLLILDNAPTHPSVELHERENGRFKAQFLPPNVTSLIQPMDQGIIECMKRHYRRQLLRKLLLADEDENGTVEFLKKINLKDCCYMVAEAWESVKSTSLKRAWNKINGICTKEQIQKEKEQLKQNEGEITNDNEADEMATEISGEEMQSIIKQIPGCNECDASDIDEWLQCDKQDMGFQLLSDDEIIESVLVDETSETAEEENVNDEEPGPTASEAFACLDTALKWVERQSECDRVHLLAVKRLRDLAARKRVESSRQLTLLDMFK